MTRGDVTEQQKASGVDAVVQMRTPLPVDNDGWRLLPEPTTCEGHTHRYYNNEDKCVCERGPDLSKRRMR